eukprot:GGOE01027983.1.p3 GENE.GGOE01027983.1~~GGOE01027983.1.p3  ORF type:complete len:122 (+),score=3.99 GGOE01027983.1:406-771(+)
MGQEMNRWDRQATDKGVGTAAPGPWPRKVKGNGMRNGKWGRGKGRGRERAGARNSAKPPGEDPRGGTGMEVRAPINQASPLTSSQAGQRGEEAVGVVGAEGNTCVAYKGAGEERQREGAVG